MRILEVVHGFPPAAQGGTELYAQAHARALGDEGGNEVVVFTREQDPQRAEYDVRTEQRDGLRIVWVNNTFRNTRTFEETYRNDAIGAIASRLIDDFKPQAAHVHHLTGLSTTIVRSLADRHIPCCLTLHDYWFLCHRGQLLDVNDRVCPGPPCDACLGPAAGAGRIGFAGAAAVRGLEKHLPDAPARELRRVAERVAAVVSSADEAEDQKSRRTAHMRQVCADVTHFLAPSRSMRDRFVQFGVPPEKITVLANGVDPRPFRRIERTSSPYVVSGFSRTLRLGFIGALMISKGPHVLLEAAGHLPSGSVSVDLFGPHTSYHGDDSYRQRLQALLGHDGVRAHGAIPHEQIAQALASIDVLVVPSIWPENAPLVIQEAFLAGVPVVASRIGGIPEMVAEGRSGLLFHAGDVEDLARTLTRLLDEPELLGSLRVGIAPVRSIEEDVRFARRLYQQFQPQRTQRTQRPAFPAIAAASAVDLKQIAAVVLNFRTPDETLLAVKSLLASRRPLDDLIVVNNDSGDSGDGSNRTRDALKNVWSRISYIQTGTNLGFSGGMNIGIREALDRGADRVLLVNSDVIVPPDAIGRLERSLDATPHTGIAGPVVLSRSEPDKIASLGMSYRPSTGRMRHRGTGRTGALADLARATAAGGVDGVSGCLMLVKREVFEAAGFFDEDYFFSFEDLDFCLKARRAGFTTILAEGATIYHEGGQSLGPVSPRRFYFAARNHLLLAERAEPSAGRFASIFRGCSIVMLNLAHAVVSPGGSLPARLSAVAHGTRDYVTGRFGSGL
jgi:GT2 family glycosyltransferase/glycosyltransferase involved in cell wall biosynthesis